MLFHGKALEIYTAAYQNIQNIDENEDLEVRVIKICFSIYLLQKKEFSHFAAIHIQAENATYVSGSQNKHLHVYQALFCTFPARAYRIINSEILKLRRTAVAI